MSEKDVDSALSYMQRVTDAKRNGTSVPTITLDELFRSDDIKGSLKSDGVTTVRTRHGKLTVGATLGEDKKTVETFAAAMTRDPGKAEDLLAQVADYTDEVMERVDRIALYKRIYRKEGIINNSINKQAALVSTDGGFKVRYVKGQRGKASDVKAEEFRQILQFFQENVNSRPIDAVMTGARGIKAFMAQGVRQALIEGDHFGRTVWRNTRVPALNKDFSLPINIQSFSSEHIEIPEHMGGIELIYWVPPQEFIDNLEDPDDENAKEYLDKLIPPEIQSELINNGRYLLDPSLMLHIKHRGIDAEPYGESAIECSMADIAYKRSLEALDLITIESLINRIVVISVGSDNVDSIYHEAEVSKARLRMLERILRETGPNATILWPGPDLKVEEVGAHDSILAMDDRHKLAESRIRRSMGVPSALLTGEGVDGKAAGWAATIGVAAQLQELQDNYKQTLKAIAERIAEENGFEDVDVDWEFHHDLLANAEVQANISLRAYQTGLYSTQTAVEELGKNYEAEEVRQQDDVARGYKDEPFGPPRMVMTTNPNGDGGDQGGHPGPQENDNEGDPREDTEQQETDERN